MYVSRLLLATTLAAVTATSVYAQMPVRETPALDALLSNSLRAGATASPAESKAGSTTTEAQAAERPDPVLTPASANEKPVSTEAVKDLPGALPPSSIAASKPAPPAETNANTAAAERSEPTTTLGRLPNLGTLGAPTPPPAQTETAPAISTVPRASAVSRDIIDEVNRLNARITILRLKHQEAELLKKIRDLKETSSDKEKSPLAQIATPPVAPSQPPVALGQPPGPVPMPQTERDELPEVLRIYGPADNLIAVLQLDNSVVIPVRKGSTLPGGLSVQEITHDSVTVKSTQSKKRYTLPFTLGTSSASAQRTPMPTPGGFPPVGFPPGGPMSMAILPQ